MLRSFVYEDEIIPNVPIPKINADLVASFHITRSTDNNQKSATIN